MLTNEEAELYDRQIRLWGVNAQKRLRQSKVLMLGFGGVASEVAKTLVLAGIDKLTIVDDLPLQESDLTSNLFCRKDSEYRTDFVKEKLKTLNPLVNVDIQNKPITSVVETKDIETYDLVTLHSLLKIEDIERINGECRRNGVKFYMAVDFGFYGFMFSDLGDEYQFTHEEFRKNEVIVNNEESNAQSDSDIVDDSDEDNRPKKKRRRVRSPARKSEDEKFFKLEKISYCPFNKFIVASRDVPRTSPAFDLSIALLNYYNSAQKLPTDETDLKSIELKDSIKKLNPGWMDDIQVSLSPVCAVIGGVVGQDMIRSLSGKDVPIFNTFSFDGINMKGNVHCIGAKCETKNNVRDVLEIDDD